MQSMTLNKTYPSSPNNPIATDISSMVGYAEPSIQESTLSTIIPMPSDASPVVSSILTTETKDPAGDCSGFQYVSSQKQTAAKQISTSYLRNRLGVRQFYFVRLAFVSNVMSFLAIFGIILMIIENEITFVHIDNKETKVTWFIKLIITLSTVILIALIFQYHRLDMTLFAYRNLLDGWYVALTYTRVLTITIEVLICIIHPMPRSYPHGDPQQNDSISYSLSYTSVDVALGLPMFLRLYLLGRSIMIYSPLVRNIPLRSVAYLNHVSVNSFFLIKTYLEKWPTRCLLTFCTVVFLIGSWSLRACDYNTTGEHMSMSDSMWLLIITATTVGYGDLYPSTYCGRSIAAVIGLFGLLLTALLIAILTQKLHLTREEKYAHTFVSNTQLNKNLKNHAANIIKFAMKSWHLKRRNKAESMQYLQAQRKLFQSIHSFQQIKHEKHILVDSCVGFTELITAQRTTNAQTEETATQIAAMKTEMKDVKNELTSLNHNVNVLQNTLYTFLDKLQK